MVVWQAEKKREERDSQHQGSGGGVGAGCSAPARRNAAHVPPADHVIKPETCREPIAGRMFRAVPAPLCSWPGCKRMPLHGAVNGEKSTPKLTRRSRGSSTKVVAGAQL
jgi:hypothetical protein